MKCPRAAHLTHARCLPKGMRFWSTDKKKRKEKSIRQNKMKQYFKASSKTQSSASVNRLGTNSATSSANSLFEN